MFKRRVSREATIEKNIYQRVLGVWGGEEESVKEIDHEIKEAKDKEEIISVGIGKGTHI